MDDKLTLTDAAPFYKFDGAGNDFILMDLRGRCVQLSQRQISRLCNRRIGIGADGFMTLHEAPDGYDFEMRYYNSDGLIGSMCGNGGRCVAVFAALLGLGRKDSVGGNTKLSFMGPDGPHDAVVLHWDRDAAIGIVDLGMRSVLRQSVRKVLDGWFLDTGSPHYVQRVVGLADYDVVGQGRRIRNMLDVFPQGTNVDFIEDLPDGRLAVRTYERGVEDETWACGTGVTACAIVSGNRNVKCVGGDFKVSFNPTDTHYEAVRLIGPVAFNFYGMTLL